MDTHQLLKFLTTLGIVALAGCGSGQQAVSTGPEPQARAAEPEHARSRAEERAAVTAEPNENTHDDSEAEPANGPIDLLRATRTAVAVSSAYQDKAIQAARLFDGNLETAWNSKSGDLAGAWFDVRLPEKASVSSIALTAGFTKSSGTSDLFTGNHRVSKIRVLHDGQELGVFQLDTSSRELQEFPVEGAGGIYRIEVVSVEAGSKTRWREVCISELRIMGRAPDMREGERFPVFAVGLLPEPRSEPGSTERTEISRLLRQTTAGFVTEWGALLNVEQNRRTACALDEDEERAAPGYRHQRRLVLDRVAELVTLVDEVRADRLRFAAIEQPGEGSSSWDILRDDDHDLLAAGFDAVVDWLNDDEARCRWARADAGLRLVRVQTEVASRLHACEHIPMDYDEEYPAPPELERECRHVYRVDPLMRDLRYLWEENPRMASLRIQRFEMPELTGRTLPEWEALRARVSIARQACGWSSE